MTYAKQYIEEALLILKQLDQPAIERTADLLLELRERSGRLFFLGVGGGAGHASHAVCDFRKIAQIEAYAPSDNASELTARVNDEGWDTCYANWLRGSRLNDADMVFVFSVGLHRSGRGRLRPHSRRQFVDHNSSHGIFSSHDLAPLGFPPETQNG